MNCQEFLDKRLQVRWELRGDYVQITLTAKMREDQYVAFGLSGAPTKSQMVIDKNIYNHTKINVSKAQSNSSLFIG